MGRSRRFAVAFAAGAIAASSGLRLALDAWLPQGLAFVTFFPAIILTAFFAGARAAVAVAVATGLVAWGVFIAPDAVFSTSASALLAMLFFFLTAATDIALVHLMTTAFRRMAEAEAKSASFAQARALMFNELQHRVSNNIAMIGSLLKLQERRVSDPQARAALADSRARLEVVARLQRRLHDPDRQSVQMRHFLEELAEDTLAAMDAASRVTCVYDIDALTVDPDQAMPLGLVTAELVMNACEHGFPDGAEGLVVIRLRHETAERRALLAIEDDGRGLPAGFDPGSSQSLGLTIARQFAVMMGGRLTIRARATGGTRAELAFPLAAVRP